MDATCWMLTPESRLTARFTHLWVARRLWWKELSMVQEHRPITLIWQNTEVCRVLKFKIINIDRTSDIDIVFKVCSHVLLVAPAESRATYLLTIVSVCLLDCLLDGLIACLWTVMPMINTRWLIFDFLLDWFLWLFTICSLIHSQ